MKKREKVSGWLSGSEIRRKGETRKEGRDGERKRKIMRRRKGGTRKEGRGGRRRKIMSRK